MLSINGYSKRFWVLLYQRFNIITDHVLLLNSLGRIYRFYPRLKLILIFFSQG